MTALVQDEEPSLNRLDPAYNITTSSGKLIRTDPYYGRAFGPQK
jgi:hypothetical protein